MVIAKIIGGLGNQLFQYAAARKLSIIHRTDLKLDVSGFDSYDWHAYSLKPFRIKEEFATAADIQRVTGSPREGLARITASLRERLNPYHRSNIFAEPDLGPFDPAFLKTPKSVYLSGYWQSEKYFEGIEDILRTEFSIKYEPDSKSREIATMIDNTQSVSVHVRRGNYVSNPQVNSVHGTCSLEYYQECVKRIAQKVHAPHFFVFSDDPAWVKANLSLDYPTTIILDNDAARDYEDLRLMSLCKHQIIANSTFSWWGAWLNSNPEKIVLAPRQWFKDTRRNTRDLIPEKWTVI